MTKVLDVRLPDDFAAGHIPGALNNPVFEVQFLERLGAQLADKEAPITICGANASSAEAGMAREKLARAGYREVEILEGGFEGWCGTDGNVPESATPLPPAPEGPQGTCEIDLENSFLKWTGRNLLNHHHGRVALASGSLEFDQGSLEGGTITIDLTKITCDDLAGTPGHDILVKHLQDHDFFDVGLHPTAELRLLSAEAANDSPGSQNLLIRAELTLRGKTCPLEFTAACGISPEGKAAAQAGFSIDRTRWGVIYGSGRFFHRLAGHLVNDLIEFQVKIVTR